VAYRLPASSILETFEKLWAREMSTGAYVPKWLRCSTEHGDISTLCFVVNREAVSYVPKLQIDQTLEIIAHAHGRYGPCVEYVLQTHDALEASGIRDKRLAEIAAAIKKPPTSAN
jgi:cation transport protein ChaC